MKNDSDKVIDTIASCTKKIHRKAALKMIELYAIKHPLSNAIFLINFLNDHFSYIKI